MAWRVAVSLERLLAEINTSAPRRSKRSDGSIGDPAHAARVSDHNPCECHRAVCARDFTHDPSGGFDAHAFADWLIERVKQGAESRPKYVISRGRIASGKSGWRWRDYGGSNPHNAHVHVSVSHPSTSFDSRASWGWTGKPPLPEPPKPLPPTMEEDGMLIIICHGKPHALLSGGRMVPYADSETGVALMKTGVERITVSARDYSNFLKGFEKGA